MNVIKRDVRASLNMNSSYENSCCDDPSNQTSRIYSQESRRAFTPNKTQLNVPIVTLCKGIKKRLDNAKQISTPVRVRDTANPFQCTLSPIGIWDLQHFKKRSKISEPVRFEATAVENPGDVNGTKNASELASEPKSNVDVTKSPLSLIMENIKSRRSRKQVCFDQMVLTSDDIITNGNSSGDKRQSVALQPGKWRKSLNLWRRTKSTIPMGKYLHQ